MEATLVIDMNNDFITGSYAVPGAIDLIGPLQNHLDQHRGDAIGFTLCNHPENHCSFVENGGIHIRHCVTGTWGQRLHVGLEAMRAAARWPVFEKGLKPHFEEYSGFANPRLDQWLRGMGVSVVKLVGVAREYCVQATYDDAMAHGYQPVIIEHLTRRFKP